MARRRASARRVKTHHNYTVEEAAKTTGKHPHTIRRWIESEALPALTEKRPHLILGRDLIAFLTAPRPGKARLKPGECYCLKCRQPRRPALDMADYTPMNDRIGNLQGICTECGTVMNRRVSHAALSAVAVGLDVTVAEAKQHLMGRFCPFTNVDFEGEYHEPVKALRR